MASFCSFHSFLYSQPQKRGREIGYKERNPTKGINVESRFTVGAEMDMDQIQNRYIGADWGNNLRR